MSYLSQFGETASFISRQGSFSDRIHNALVAELTKFPYLLSPKHPLTNMIIQDTHKKLHHGGAATTMTALWQIYWIPTIHQRVRAQLSTFAKTMDKPYQIPDPPPLPKVRVGNSRPFTVTGVDFTGTLYVKESNVKHKAYICLFTCASTRAIYLEIVMETVCPPLQLFAPPWILKNTHCLLSRVYRIYRMEAQFSIVQPLSDESIS